MKVKTFHALLLSIVMITGVVTINDAFAQTNTERLVTVADTTADTNDRVVQLTEIWNNFGSQFTPITDALNMVAEEITAISNDISTLSEDVMDTSAKVDSLEDKLDEYVETRTSDSAEMMGQIDTLADALPDIQDKITALAGDTSVGELVNKVDNIAAQLNDFSSALNTIQTEVQTIQGELGIIKSGADAETGPAPTELNEDTLSEDVLVSWYAHGLKETPEDSMYSSKYYFICESDVFIGTVDAKGSPTHKLEYNTIENGEKITKDDAVITTRIYGGTSEARLPSSPTTYDTNLFVNKNLLFDTHLTGVGTTGGITEQPYHNKLDFKLMELKAGRALVFESQTSATSSADNAYILDRYTSVQSNTLNATGIPTLVETGVNLVDWSTSTTDVFNATRKQVGDVVGYSVMVQYYSEATDAACRISQSGVAPLDNVGQKATVTPTLAESDGILTTYKAELGCDLDHAMITDVRATITTGGDGLNQYVDMELLVGDETKAEFTFADNKLVTDADSLPIELRGENLNITGNILTNAELLIEFTYDTIQGIECKQVTE